MKASVQFGRWLVNYTVEGEGFPLILLHGGAPASSGASSFSKNIEHFAKHFKTYAIDFPGWGESSNILVPPGQWDNPMEVGAEVVAGFMHALSLKKAHLVGGSFGGAVALYVALNHPTLVDRLVLAAPAGGMAKGMPTPALIKLLTYYGTDKPTLDSFRSLMQHMVFDKTLIPEEMIEERYALSCAPSMIEGFPLRMPPTEILQAMVPLCTHPKLDSVSVPVLFVWGMDDEVQPFEGLASFHRLQKQTSLILGKCGHWPYWEYPDTFNEEASKFLLSAQSPTPA